MLSKVDGLSADSEPGAIKSEHDGAGKGEACGVGVAATKCLKKTSSKTRRGANTNPVQTNLSLGKLDAAMPPAIAPRAAATAAAAALRKLMDASVLGSPRFGCWLSTAGLTNEGKQRLAEGAGRRPRRVRIGGELRVHR